MEGWRTYIQKRLSSGSVSDWAM